MKNLNLLLFNVKPGSRIDEPIVLAWSFSLIRRSLKTLHGPLRVFMVRLQ